MSRWPFLSFYVEIMFKVSEQNSSTTKSAILCNSHGCRG